MGRFLLAYDDKCFYFKGLAKAIKGFSGGSIDIHPLGCKRIQKILNSYYGGGYKEDFYLIERHASPYVAVVLLEYRSAVHHVYLAR